MSDTTGKSIASIAIAAAIAYGMYITQNASPLWAGLIIVMIWRGW